MFEAVVIQSTVRSAQRICGLEKLGIGVGRDCKTIFTLYSERVL